jgi:pimeloyl-ACP methyl ester carboxylesterase
MTSSDDAPAGSERIDYDEFGLFHENAAEYGLSSTGTPVVRRAEVALADGRNLSGLLWGDDPAELVLLHGGSQNAHTWDTVVMALGRPAVCIDLPGHGHSDWRDDGAYSPSSSADDVAEFVRRHAPGARVVVGMSYGGITAMELAVRHPELVRSLVMVDITPGVNAVKAKAVLDFVDGPQSFPDFASLLARTIEHNPTRTVSSLRRGILHNAKQLDDGSWQWRYDRSSHGRSRARTPDQAVGEHAPAADATDQVAAKDPVMNPLWEDFSAVACPLLLVRGSVSPVVDDADVAEARRRQPDITVEVVDGAGHSVQGDRPLELAALLASRLG